MCHRRASLAGASAGRASGLHLDRFAIKVRLVPDHLDREYAGVGSGLWCPATDELK